MAGSVSAWNRTISCTLTEGTTSQGMTAPSITPLLKASASAGTGMDTGVAPKAASIRLVMRVGARTFMPRKSSSVRMGRSRVWM